MRTYVDTELNQSKKCMIRKVVSSSQVVNSTVETLILPRISQNGYEAALSVSDNYYYQREVTKLMFYK